MYSCIEGTPTDNLLQMNPLVVIFYDEASDHFMEMNFFDVFTGITSQLGNHWIGVVLLSRYPYVLQ